MKKIDYLICTTLALIALVSRVPLIEKFQSHWDGPDYSIAVVRYSFEQHTPTAPGYPLYVALGKFFHIFFFDPYTAILLVSVFGSIVGVIAFYIFGKKVYNIKVGIAAAAIFLTASTFYYFSLTPYGFELLIGGIILLAYSVYRIFVQKKQEGVYFGIVSAICFGIRPQEMLVIGPLAILGFIFLNKKQKLISAAVFCFITLLWLIPLIQTNGGLNSFINFYLTALRADVFKYTFQHNLELVIKGFLLTFGVSSFFLFYYLFAYLRKKTLPKNKILFFYALWILPGILFNLFVRAEHAGYQISYLGGFIILISYAIWKLTKKGNVLYLAIVLIIAVFNLFWFFYNRDPNFVKSYRPTSFHYSDIRKNDLKTGSKIRFVKENFSPNNTLLISTEAMWRPYSYYLKSYKLIALNALDNTEAPYIYNRYEAINWNMQHEINKDFTIEIPRNVSVIVFLDDNSFDWIQNNNFIKYNLPANSSITSIKTKKGQEIYFGYHTIELR